MQREAVGDVRAAQICLILPVSRVAISGLVPPSMIPPPWSPMVVDPSERFGNCAASGWLSVPFRLKVGKQLELDLKHSSSAGGGCFPNTPLIHQIDNFLPFPCYKGWTHTSLWEGFSSPQIWDINFWRTIFSKLRTFLQVYPSYSSSKHLKLHQLALISTQKVRKLAKTHSGKARRLTSTWSLIPFDEEWPMLGRNHDQASSAWKLAPKQSIGAYGASALPFLCNAARRMKASGKHCFLSRERAAIPLSVVITKCQTRRAALFCDSLGGRGVVFILRYHGSGFKDVLGTWEEKDVRGGS